MFRRVLCLRISRQIDRVAVASSQERGQVGSPRFSRITAVSKKPLALVPGAFSLRSKLALPLSGDLCRLSFPDAVAQPFADDSAGVLDEVAGSGVAVPDVIPVAGVAPAAGVVGDVAPVACEARAADAVPAHARRGGAAPWPGAEPVPHEAFESAAVAVRDSPPSADAMFPADVVPAHAVRQLAAALRVVAQLPHGAPLGAYYLLPPPPVAEPARNSASSYGWAVLARAPVQGGH